VAFSLLYDKRSAPVSKQRLSDQVYDLVRADIRNGRYTLDMRFTELEIAQALSISRTPVREAIFQLVRHGLLQEYERGYGLPSLDQVQFHKLIKMRELLDGEVARRFTATVNSARIKQLEAAWRAEEAAVEIDDLTGFISIASAFRDVFFDNCDNEYLRETAELYADRTQAARVVTYANLESRRTAVRGHGKVVKAVASRNAERACEAAQACAREFETAWMRIVGQSSPA